MIDDNFKNLAETAVDRVPAIKRTGVKIIGLRDRYCQLLMPLEGNMNHVGMMYAGSLFTLGELPGGIIVMASYELGTYIPIVKEVAIRFVKPALTDVTLELSWSKEYAEALGKEASEKGKANFPLNMEIKDTGSQVVSLVTGVWQIRPMPREGLNPFK